MEERERGREEREGEGEREGASCHVATPARPPLARARLKSCSYCY